eukprot:gnl/Spiro4/5921_TR3031_c0_g1_i1.p1 gnl/Spiro4/5921_TR3031_c0_g1~~gnl/Spiro4/5921_TR3031_c0_g1_i1.p1  ORF type:complete len:187 (-),score=14.19 gnl/Spiro4/5921_TR3031_c0_g1_i1:92-652(-)
MWSPSSSTSPFSLDLFQHSPVIKEASTVLLTHLFRSCRGSGGRLLGVHLRISYIYPPVIPSIDVVLQLIEKAYRPDHCGIYLATDAGTDQKLQFLSHFTNLSIPTQIGMDPAFSNVEHPPLVGLGNFGTQIDQLTLSYCDDLLGSRGSTYTLLAFALHSHREGQTRIFDQSSKYSNSTVSYLPSPS